MLISGASGNTLLENAISGKDSYGVSITGSGADGNTLEANLTGTQADGATALVNGSHGIAIAGGAFDNAVETNTIAHNGGDGVNITDNATMGNTVWENTIHSNTGLGIDLGQNGITDNDTGDGNSGPHGLQNYPELTAGIVGDEVQIFGSLNSAASTNCIVNFYTSDACDASGNGEGRAWLGFSSVTTNTAGAATLGITFGVSTWLGSILDTRTPVGRYITATGPHGTSEFSACVQASDLPKLDLSATSVSIDEAGNNNSGVSSVALTGQPAADLSAHVINTGSDTVLALPAAFSFATDDWNTGQNLTIPAVEDPDVSDEDLFFALYTLDTANNVYFPGVAIGPGRRDDFADITISGGSANVNEGGTVDYTVVPPEQPSADIVVSRTSSDTDKATVSLPTFTFKTTDWDTAQIVTVMGVQNNDGWDHGEEITHEITLSDESYVADILPVPVWDDDQTRLELLPESLTIAEGNSDTYPVALSETPSAAVTVTLASTDLGAVTGWPGDLILTNTEWNTARAITLDAVADNDGVEESAGILHVVTVDGEDLIIDVVVVGVTDVDEAPVLSGPTSVDYAENLTAGVATYSASDPESQTSIP